MANGTTMEEVGRGDVVMMFMGRANKSREFFAKDVPYMPDIEANIWSVSQMAKRGLVVTFPESEAIISRNEEVVAVVYLEDGLYRMKKSTITMASSRDKHDEPMQ